MGNFFLDFKSGLIILLLCRIRKALWVGWRSHCPGLAKTARP